MNAEEQIQMLKQIPPQSKAEKSRNLRRAVVLAMATVVSVLFLVYAFVQKLEADNQRISAEKMHGEILVQKAAAEFEEQRAMEAMNRMNNQLVSTLRNWSGVRMAKSKSKHC